jgi:hypothetical protein
MIRQIRVLICWLCCSVLCMATIQAHETSSNTGFWVTSGAGAGTTGLGLYLSMNLSYQPSYFFTLRTAGDHEMNLLKGLGHHSPQESLRDYGILAGVRTRRDRFGYLALAGGVSYVKGVRRGRLLYRERVLFGSSTYESVNISTVGFPVEAHAVLNLGKGFAIGTTGYADINSQRTDSGILLTFSMGGL